MPNTTFQAILGRVEKPSRYLGTEVNSIRKEGEIPLRIGLTFPDLYEIGTSHFGLQILYDILNRDAEIAAERIYAVAPDMGDALRSAGLPLSTLETRTPLADLDMLGFSLLYELNYTGVLDCLDLAGIPFFAKDRDENFPLVFAGGPCVCNPEPMADFFDFMLMGDGEEQLLEVCRAVIGWKKAEGATKKDILETLSGMDGVYIPSFFEPSWDENGFQHLAPIQNGKASVKKAVLASMEEAAFPVKPILPFGKPVHDRLRLEVARGCTRGCRFCQAGILYRPVRERSVKRLLDITEEALKVTGYDDMSLLSLSTGDYGCLPELMEHLMERYAKEQRSVSLPSIRAGRLNARLMEQIRRVRKTGFTIAPEAGTQRLRDVINKNITEEQVVETVKSAFSLGWDQIKLYFMIGLPTETDEDLDGILELADTLRQIRTSSGRWGKITVSVGTFIPKPHAPFQWAGMISVDEALRRFRYLKEKAKGLRGVTLKWHDPNVSRLEGLFSRGDRRLSKVLVKAYEKGCILDGWSEYFKKELWFDAIEEEGIDIDFFVTRDRDLDEPLPWDHMDMRVKKSFLAREWKRAINAELTPDCREGTCSACGICDFKTIQPDLKSEAPGLPDVPEAPKPSSWKTLHMDFEKRGNARFFGHLEMAQIFNRAFRMCDVPMKFSEGFHPHPQIRFSDPIPLGMESLCEWVTVEVDFAFKPAGLVDKMNAALPEGLRITTCELAKKRARDGVVRYRIHPGETPFDPAGIPKFMESDTWMIEKLTKKGKIKTRDIRDWVLELRLDAEKTLYLSVKKEDAQSVRPSEILATVFGIDKDAQMACRVEKLLVTA